MCTSTRFPEAIPLRNIKAKTIVKALIKVFTLVGLSKSIQSDQDSNFMSGVFQQIVYELGSTSPLHITQRVKEPLNGSTKLLRTC